jgi:hemolysin III
MKNRNKPDHIKDIEAKDTEADDTPKVLDNSSDKMYTVGEEVFNSVTHGIGALFGLIGGSIIVTLAVIDNMPKYGNVNSGGNSPTVLACLIYAISLVLLYTMSTLYHAFPFPGVKRLFRIFDHSSVFVLIAGTYTPFMLITLHGQTIGIVIFIVVWSITVVGTAINAIDLKRFSKISLMFYLVMGWCIVIAIKPLIGALAINGLILLFIGGACYTVGCIFYVIKKVHYMHSIWHLFVLAGSVLHFCCIALYVLP